MYMHTVLDVLIQTHLEYEYIFIYNSLFTLLLIKLIFFLSIVYNYFRQGWWQIGKGNIIAID